MSEPSGNPQAVAQQKESTSGTKVSLFSCTPKSPIIDIVFTDSPIQVTTDRQTLSNPKNENPGVVTSDSLAAESINEGGSFGANSDSRGPGPQPSYSTTTATTDVSSATRLEPTTNARSRVGEGEEAGLEDRAMGSRDALGRGETESAPLISSTGGNTMGGTGPGPQTSSSSTGGSAPTQTSSASVEGYGENSRPKGQNITEGGFDPNLPNASRNTDIGSKNDPGRAGLQDLQNANTPFAGGAGPSESEITNTTKYDALDGETQA